MANNDSINPSTGEFDLFESVIYPASNAESMLSGAIALLGNHCESDRGEIFAAMSLVEIAKETVRGICEQAGVAKRREVNHG